MDKEYFREFRRRMIRMHVIMAMVCAAGAGLLFLFMDGIWNGAVIDTVENTLGRNLAVWVMNHKTAFIMAFICLLIFISFFMLESFFLNRVDRIFRNIGVLFQKDDQFLKLDDDFALLEQDLNQLKRENQRSEQLVELETKRKLDMITYLAHDIKTPLASIIGYLCLLDETDNLPEDVRKKYTFLTLEKAYRLETLVNEFFELTRFNIGKIPLQRESVDLNTMMQQLADEFYPMAERYACPLEVEVPEDIYIYADADKIARVFNNILKNALAYGSKGSPIRIAARQKDAGVEISFENAGREIPKEKLERIFEQFYRLDESRNSGTGGSGLGLAIAREIVKEHGGTIEADSGQGRTIFTVWLPDRKTGDKAAERSGGRDTKEKKEWKRADGKDRETAGRKKTPERAGAREDRAASQGAGEAKTAGAAEKEETQTPPAAGSSNS